MAADAAPLRLRPRRVAAFRRRVGRLVDYVPTGDQPDVDVTGAQGPSAGPTRVWAAYLAMAVGAAAVCIAFAMSRSGTSGASVVYWFGEFVLAVACIAVCLPRTPSVGERLTALLMLSGLQSLLVWAYSPEQFSFPDELQHVRTTHNIIATGHLFTPNSALPVSPGFPGLEIVTSAFSELAGISVFAAGVVTASIGHIILVAVVFAWARAVGFSDRTASVAALVYGFAPGYPYFDSLFTYTAVALPFFVLAARAAAGSLRRQSLLLLVLPPLFIAVVSHHLTGYLTVAVVAVIGGLIVAAGNRTHGMALLGVALIGAAAAAAWTVAFSPDAFDYLLRPAKVALANLFGHSSDAAGNVGGRGVPTPVWERLLGYGGAAVMLGLALVGAIAMWRTYWSDWRRYLGLCALLYPAVLGVRLLAADGPELATRLLPYSMLLICLPVALLLGGLWDTGRRVTMSLAGVAAVVVAVGTQVVSLPQSWERLPGKFHVAAFNSGVDARVSAAAAYAQATLPPGSRIACDVMMCSLVSGEADVTATVNAAPVFYATTVASRRLAISDDGIDAVIVDDRLGEQPPYTGIYFSGQSEYLRSNQRYPAQAVADFAADPELARVYDNGAVQIYTTSADANG